ncbi:unnamed protein product [Caenorhabditis angaria]|uniref:THAP-type domain-containing protein n=1 Tax=Caenorhabditis angaria TaxID=860376 RepID=A0A9P1I7B8_9PELO|nr:unnamed protein product [Caenorhabditis angaria]
MVLNHKSKCLYCGLEKQSSEMRPVPIDNEKRLKKWIERLGEEFAANLKKAIADSAEHFPICRYHFPKNLDKLSEKFNPRLLPIANKDYYKPRKIYKKKTPMTDDSVDVGPIQYGAPRVCRKIAKEQCAYCREIKRIFEMTFVTGNRRELTKWVAILGNDFAYYIRWNSRRLICLSHFELAPGATEIQPGQLPVANYEKKKTNEPSTSQQEVQQNENLNNPPASNDFDPNIPSTSNQHANSGNEEPFFRWLERDIENAILAESQKASKNPLIPNNQQSMMEFIDKCIESVRKESEQANRSQQGGRLAEFNEDWMNPNIPSTSNFGNPPPLNHNYRSASNVENPNNLPIANVESVRKNQKKKKLTVTNCAYCEKRKYCGEMTSVTKNESELKKWIDILGNTFEANVARRRSLPMICLSHFDLPPGSRQLKKRQLPVANYNADSTNDDSIPLKKKGRKFKRIRGRKSAKKNDTSQEVQQNETIAENNDDEVAQTHNSGMLTVYYDQNWMNPNIPSTSNVQNLNNPQNHYEPLTSNYYDPNNLWTSNFYDPNIPTTSNFYYNSNPNNLSNAFPSNHYNFAPNSNFVEFPPRQIQRNENRQEEDDEEEEEDFEHENL